MIARPRVAIRPGLAGKCWFPLTLSPNSIRSPLNRALPSAFFLGNEPSLGSEVHSDSPRSRSPVRLPTVRRDFSQDVGYAAIPGPVAEQLAGDPSSMPRSRMPPLRACAHPRLSNSNQGPIAPYWSTRCHGLMPFTTSWSDAYRKLVHSRTSVRMAFDTAGQSRRRAWNCWFLPAGHYDRAPAGPGNLIGDKVRRWI